MSSKLESARALLREQGVRALLGASLLLLGDQLKDKGEQLRFSHGGYDHKIMAGLVERPFYGYCIYVSAMLADKLSYDSVSVLEFGVGNGSGLRNIEHHVGLIEQEFDTSFEIYGFDTGAGPPAPRTYKDMPHAYDKDYTSQAYEGYAVKEWGSRSELVLGDVQETVPTFFEDYGAPPVACAFFDMNIYTSTKHALSIFDSDPEHLLPRVICHFDTVVSNEVLRAFNNEFVGENAAINEFNDEHEDRKVAKVKYKHPWRLEAIEPNEIYQFHAFDHPKYGTPIRTSGDQPFQDIHPGTTRI